MLIFFVLATLIFVASMFFGPKENGTCNLEQNKQVNQAGQPEIPMPSSTGPSGPPVSNGPS